jgi:hypothetical protein
MSAASGAIGATAVAPKAHNARPAAPPAMMRVLRLVSARPNQRLPAIFCIGFMQSVKIYRLNSPRPRDLLVFLFLVVVETLYAARLMGSRIISKYWVLQPL